MPLERGFYDLMYSVAADPLPGLEPRGDTQQAHLRIGAGIGSHAPKVGAALGVFLDPHKSGGFVLEPPRLHDLDGLPDIRERGPHKTG
ncbi:hypothetical protein SDC9_191061 [bioreactor metagenome]|uniref:Uncharacterized protein n=1 Tax=bioreactor metagenome TaxID=1076179 RepID=A0A645HWS7_9ZZZZ